MALVWKCTFFSAAAIPALSNCNTGQVLQQNFKLFRYKWLEVIVAKMLLWLAITMSALVAIVVGPVLASIVFIAISALVHGLVNSPRLVSPRAMYSSGFPSVLATVSRVGARGFPEMVNAVYVSTMYRFSIK